MLGYVFSRPWTVALCVSAFCACANTAASSSADHTRTHPAPLSAQGAPSGAFTPEQWVTRLLNLIRTTKSISAMTTVQLSTAMKQTGKIIRLGNIRLQR